MFFYFFWKHLLRRLWGALLPCPPKCKCYEAQGLARGPGPRAMTQGQTDESRARAWARELRPTNMVQAENGENTECFATFFCWKQLLRDANIHGEAVLPGERMGPGPGPIPPKCTCYEAQGLTMGGQGPGPGPWAKMLKTLSVLVVSFWEALRSSDYFRVFWSASATVFRLPGKRKLRCGWVGWW